MSKKYIEVTGKEIVEAAKQCGDTACHFCIHAKINFRIDKDTFQTMDAPYHKARRYELGKWKWVASIPDKWFELLKEGK